MSTRKPPGRKKATGPKQLTPKQRLWIAAMVEHGGHLAKAAKASGLSEETSKQLHTSPRFAHVQQALREALDAVEEAAKERAVWTRERLIAKFEEIGESALTGVMSDETGLIKVNLRAACTAFAEIGKLSGFYTTKMEHKGKLTIADLMASFTEEEIAGG